MSRGSEPTNDLSALDAELQRQFDAIAEETVPERLQELERKLLELLRRRADGK